MYNKLVIKIKEQNMKKVYITIAIISVLAIAFSSCNKKQPEEQPTQPSIETSTVASTPTIKRPVLTGMDNIDYSIKNIPTDIVKYLKTTSEYKNLYTDKKFVIYYVGADCPYAQAFMDKIDPIRNDPTYTEFYNFYPEAASGTKQYSTLNEAQRSVEFSNLCQEFCIVNPLANELFTINGIGYNETEKLLDILNQIKNW